MHFINGDVYIFRKYANQRVNCAVLYYISNTVCCSRFRGVTFIVTGVRVAIKNTPAAAVSFVAKFANIVVISNVIIL